MLDFIHILAAGDGGSTSAQFYLLWVVGGGAVLFFGYLIGDGIYHTVKWRRLRRKMGQLGQRDPNL